MERIIHTSYKNDLTTISKHEQISYLEYNCTALFGSLSLTYSECAQPAPSIFISKQYLKRFLARETDCFDPEGFGVPLPQTLLAYCHKRFDTIFEKFVVHLENSAEIILNNELLSSHATDEDSSEFERALNLSVFICINAILFSSAGRDMDTIEYSHGFSDLPSYPLQGNIKRLVEELHNIFDQKLYPSTISIILPNTFLDLAIISDTTRSLHKDNYVLCKLRQSDCSETLDEVHSRLSKIPFTGQHELFNKSTKSYTFLNQVESSYEQEVEHSRKSEELAAVRLIVQFFRKSKADQNNVPQQVNEKSHFQQWKSAMESFIGLAKIWIKEKAQERKSNQDGKEALRPSFANLTNPFENVQSFNEQKTYAASTFQNAVVDDFECTYCNLVINRDIHIARFNRWDIEGRRESFTTFAYNFNTMMYGSAYNNSQSTCYHMNTAAHVDCVMGYNRRLDDLTTIIARLRIGQVLLQNLIWVCDQNASLAWYLHVAEEARDLLNGLNRAEMDFGNAVTTWTRYVFCLVIMFLLEYCALIVLPRFFS